jgi:hypothetical protein
MSVLVSGNITTQNLNPTTGVPTPGSFVQLASGNDAGNFNYSELDSAIVQVTGTYTGALTPQVSIDGATWVAIGPSTIQNINTGVYTQTIASAAVGAFNINIAGFRYFRISANAAVTGTAVLTINSTEATSAISVLGAIPTGTNSIGTVILGAGTALAGQVSNGAVTTAPGTTQTTVNSAASTNAANVKATAGNVYTIFANNASAAAKYVRLYNKATAPTVGTDVPVRVITIPASSSKEIALTVPLRFATGIGYAITGGAATLDATAVAAGDVQLALDWL